MIKTGTLQRQDASACLSFYELLILNKQLTANQGNFLLKILEKYKHIVKNSGLDLIDSLSTATWKNQFRTIDLSKSIFAESTDEGISICMKFPYSLKKEFETEIENSRSEPNNKWDAERKLRVLNAYTHNLIQLHEFCLKHNFVIEDSFLDAVSQVEEIWQSPDTIVCHSVVEDKNIVLKNSVESTVEFWNTNKTESLQHNMFLAKTMGYPVRLPYTPETPLEKIASSREKMFWIKSIEQVLDIYKDIGGIVCILLDRNTKNTLEWLETLVKTADTYDVRNLIKVCFREESDKNSQLNAWIKENNLGGKVDEGRILVFNHKPPKWLFTKNVDVKIIVTNSYTPHSEPISTSWLSSHPCVCYVGEIKPTPPRNRTIVSL